MEDHGKTREQLVRELTELRHVTDLRQKAEEQVRTQHPKPTELQQSEQRQKAILDNIPDLAWLKDKKGCFLAINPAWCSFFGMNAQDALGKTAFELLSPEMAAKFEELDRSIVQSVRAAGTLLDITERKQAEEALRKSEASLREAQEVACLGFYVIDIAQQQWSSSEVLDGIFDVPADYAWTEEGWGKLVHPDDRQSVLDSFHNGVLEKHEPFDREYRIVRYGDQQVRWVHGLGRLEFDSAGHPIGMLGTIQDITERKAADQKVRESESVLRSFFDSPGIMRGIVEVVGDDILHLSDNSAAAAFFGRSQESMHNKFASEIGVPKDILRNWIEHYEESRRTNHPVKFEYRHASGSGENWLLATVSFLETAPDGHSRYVYVVNDITDIKRTETILRETQDRLALAANAAHIGMFDWNVLTGEVAWTVQHEVIFGYLPTTTTTASHAYRDWTDRLHPDDLPWVEERIRCCMAERTLYQVEYRIVWPDGSHHWIAGQGRAYYDAEGRATRMLGTVMDITERKQAEDALCKSEARYRSLFENNLDGIFLTRPNGAVEDANPAACAMLGMSKEEIIRVGRAGIVDPNDARLPALLEKRDRMGRINCELNFVRKDGGKFPTEVSSVVLNDDDDGQRKAFVMVRDITERKRAEEALRASKEQYELAVRGAGVGIWDCDVRTGKVYYSPRWKWLFGFDESDIGDSLEDWANLLHPDERDWVLKFQADFLAGTSPTVTVEYRLRHKDGSYRWIEAHALVVRDEHGKACRLVGSHGDISDRRRLEQEKLDMERQLLHAQKLESLGILAGGIAHDFNNILAGIMGYADLVKVQLPESEPARKDLDIIKKAVERAAHLTRQMLAYSGKGKFVVEPVSLSRIVKDMRAMLEMSISKKATLNCNLASKLPMIEADASQIHQIILNLVINASEALGEDSGVIAISTDTIHCNASDCAVLGGENLREGLYVRLEVTDSGCGMDEQTLAKIFDPFFTKKFTGRGLGLAAVHGILRGHKGGIRVTSKPGQGTTFQVLFPAVETSAPVSAVESIPAKPWHGTGTVLVVDDEEIVRNLAKKMVEIAGFSVLTANDGEAAVRLYREHQDQIACVLLDLTMPKMNGDETFRAIRQISPGVRVILSSGYSEESATERFSGLGLAGFIQKPYQLDTMIATLREALGGDEAKIHPA